MIHINCTNCRATLEIDDAFAGGVCRCQHCGTIQTVPAHLKGNAPVAAAGTGASPKPLYQAGRHGGTGLDELSDAVMSSGLARSGLRDKGGRAGMLGDGSGHVDYAAPRQQKKKSPMLWIVLGGVAALLLLMIAGFFLFVRSTVSNAPNTPTVIKGGADDDEAAIVVPKTANFCGVDLQKASSVVYVLDRGSASSELFDTLKATAYRSLETLGPGKRFAIVFWETGGSPSVSYPETGLADATPENIEAADRAFEDVIAHGRSDAVGAIKDAAARGPTDVVFVTGKADDIGDEVVAAIDQSLAGKRVHTFAMGEDFGSTLKGIAQKHNGTYLLIRPNQLRAFSRSN